VRALWKIETRQSTTYFLGSFHLLKEGTEWMDARITSALKESKNLTVEVDQAQIQGFDKNLGADNVLSKLAEGRKIPI